MIAAGYCLDLYCDAEGCGAKATFTGELGSDCRKRARRAGWKFAWCKTGVDLCPACARRGAKPPPPGPTLEELGFVRVSLQDLAEAADLKLSRTAVELMGNARAARRKVPARRNASAAKKA